LQGDQLNDDDLHAMFGKNPSYEQIIGSFEIPNVDHYNMATATVDRHASGEKSTKIALICVDDRENIHTYSYAELRTLSNRFGNFLRANGVKKGDVIALFSQQGLECAMAHLAAYKLGAIVAPLSYLYGPGAVEHVLNDCGARWIVTQRHLWDRVKDANIELNIQSVIVSGGAREGEIDFHAAIHGIGGDNLKIENTGSDDPALLLYSSGSTGLPKGILHKQALLRGYLASVSLFYELDMGKEDQILWTLSDWSWVAGIFNVMLTGWYFGQTVVAGSQQFSIEWVFEFLERHEITHCFLTPTALKRLATIDNPKEHWPNIKLSAIGTGGEPLPGSVLTWSKKALDIPINEFYGLTEVNHLVGNCEKLWPIKPGSMGKAYPGHDIIIVDENGDQVSPGTVGEITASDQDPTLFIRYWNNPNKTSEIRIGTRVKTGDFGYQDDEGYFWYKGREDDLIKSGGYRIGPAEIEDALVSHAAVAEAAVIGVEDQERGQIIKAFVSLSNHGDASDRLAEELKQHVKHHLAFFKYPRIIDFVEDFPLTSTGKISRKELRLREKLTRGGEL